MMNKRQMTGDIWILLCIPVLCVLLYVSVLENDTFWLINTGKYIIENGFPFSDPFTMHSGLKLTVQQWLTTVIFYKLYESFGGISIHILCLAAYTAISFIMYYTYLTVDKESKHFAFALTVFFSIALGYYILPRPQIFSILIFSAEILLLELYVVRKKQKVLLLLPLLSVLLINFHAAIWVIFFLLFIPFIIDGVNLRIFGLKLEGYGIKELILSFICSLAVGLLNPYGIYNMLYVVSSYGNNTINNYVGEMKSPNFQTRSGILFFIVLVIVSMIFSRAKGDKKVRHILLCIGTAYLGLSSIRSFVFFLICAVPLAAHSLKGITLPSPQINKKLTTVLTALLIIVVAMLLVTKDYRQEEYLTDFKPAGAVDYIKSNLDLNKLKLYNDFNVGGYLEYSGIRTFIDSRAELFTKAFNKKEDVLEDYAKVIKGNWHYKDFQSKYSFTHFLIYKGDLLDVYLARDNEYNLVYEDEKFVLYEKGR